MPTPTYTPLATQTLSSTASSVTFSSIPATYRDLILVVNCRHTGSGTQDLIMQFNSDAGNASRVYMAGYSSTTESGTLSNIVAQFNDQNNNEVGISHIMDYSATDKHKTVLTRTNDSGFVEAMAQRWASTAAINSIRLAYTSTFAIGSTFSLYGIQA
jgi:hypothetical protein